MTTGSNPSVLVLFGAAGDLAWRKIFPSLFSLYQEGHLPQQFQVIGIDLQDLKMADYYQHLQDGVNEFSRYAPVKKADWQNFTAHVSYLSANFTEPKTYTQIQTLLKQYAQEWNTDIEQIFYTATPPTFFGKIAILLGEAGLANDRQHARIVIEKPIGHDLDSAVQLNQTLLQYFTESQILRIDHYLGKETVQNILAFRFANPFFEPFWNLRFIEYVSITVVEEGGVGHRAAYYEHAGALRDMIQNHLMQLLCLVAMEPPVSFDADEIRNKKVDVLHVIRPIPLDQVKHFAVRGQYGEGRIQGKKVPAYRDEPGIDPDSGTETYAALKLYVDNWRWQNVPFYLRTGKRIFGKISEIIIKLRDVPHHSFPAGATLEWQSGRFAICIQPSEKIVMRFLAKKPGPKMLLKPVDMIFDYQDMFKTPSGDAYETLLLDIMENEPTLFMRADQIEASWQIMKPVLETWGSIPPLDFPNYAAGSSGPEAANQLLAQDGHSWLSPML
jgi:glucose-6-phosphate 1-dehydrogenase